MTSKARPPSSRPHGCACNDPERDAFFSWVGRLVHAHRAHLVRVARGEGLSPEDAFDAVQEGFHTFLTLPAARALVDVHDDSRKLLVVIVRNAARNRRRVAAVARPHDSSDALAEVPAPLPSVEELVAAAEDEMHLHGCVQELSELQRQVVTLRMLDEVDGESVARVLGIAPGHVAVLLHRAKANLLECMVSRGR